MICEKLTTKWGLVKIGIHFWILIINPRLMSKLCISLFWIYIFPSFKTFYKSQGTKKCRTSLVNSSAMQVLLVDKISAVFDPFLSGFLSVIRKEFEVPPYSQSVELGSQIQLRCHPPKGVPTPRVSVLKWYVCLLILCHLELPEANFQYRVSKNRSILRRTLNSH